MPEKTTQKYYSNLYLVLIHLICNIENKVILIFTINDKNESLLIFSLFSVMFLNTYFETICEVLIIHLVQVLVKEWWLIAGISFSTLVPNSFFKSFFFFLAPIPSDPTSFLLSFYLYQLPCILLHLLYLNDWCWSQ